MCTGLIVSKVHTDVGIIHRYETIDIQGIQEAMQQMRLLRERKEEQRGITWKTAEFKAIRRKRTA